MNKLMHYLVTGLMTLSLISISACSTNAAIGTPSAAVEMYPINEQAALHTVDPSRTPIFAIKFSQAMDPNSITPTSVSLAQNNCTTPLTTAAIKYISNNNDNTVFYLAPSTTLAANNQYCIVLSSQVKTQKGGGLLNNRLTFTTGEHISLEATMITPHLLESNVALKPSIIIQFSRPVAKLSPDQLQLISHGVTDEFETKVNVTAINDNQWLISPQTPLQSNSDYKLVLNNEIKDNDGNQLAITTFKFSTGSFNGPSVALLNPPRNSNDVGTVEPRIVIKFNELVNNINPNSLRLHQSSRKGPLIPIHIINLGNNQYALTSQSGSLLAATSYYLEVNSSITNSDGKPLATTYFNFTTRPNYAYIINQGNNSVSRCKVRQADKNLTDCRVTGHDFNQPTKISVDRQGNFAYISNFGTHSISVCQILAADGSLSNCHATASNLGLNSPTEIVFSPYQPLAFIANSENKSITSCIINPQTGDLEWCRNNELPKVSPATRIYSLYLDKTGTKLYAGDNSKNGHLYRCDFDGVDISSSNCLSISAGYDSLRSFAFNRFHTQAFIVNQQSGLISYCSVATGDNMMCISDLRQKFNNPEQISLSQDNGIAYIVNSSNSIINKCSIGVNGNLSCNAAHAEGLFNAPTGIYLRY